MSKSQTRQISREDLQQLFCFNQAKAAEMLGIKLAKFKDLCREKFNIPRWPSRRILGYQKEIEQLCEEILETKNEAAKPLLVTRLVYLKEAIEYIKKYPESIESSKENHSKKKNPETNKMEKAKLFQELLKKKLTPNGSFEQWYKENIGGNLKPAPNEKVIVPIENPLSLNTSLELNKISRNSQEVQSPLSPTSAIDHLEKSFGGLKIRLQKKPNGVVKPTKTSPRNKVSPRGAAPQTATAVIKSPRSRLAVEFILNKE